MATGTIQFYEHPLYTADAKEWQLYSDLFTGNPQRMRQSDRLIPYVIETTTADGKAAFAQRQERTYYTNYFKALVKLNLAFLFRYEPDLSKFIGDGQLFSTEEAKNIDGLGCSLLDFIKSIARNMIIFPRVYVAVDSPAVKQSTGSVVEQAARGIRPYASIWDALQVPNWMDQDADFADFGKIVSLQRQYQRLAPRISLSDPPRLEVVRDSYSMNGSAFVKTTYRLKKEAPDAKVTAYIDMRNQYRINQSDRWEKIAEISVPWLDQLPVIRSIHEPWMDDAAQEQMRLHQLISAYENALYFHGYPHLAIAGQPIQTTGDLPYGEQAVIWLEKDSKIMQIPADSAEGLKNRCDSCREALFKIGMNQLRQLDSSSKQVQAAETIHADKEDTLTQVRSKIHEIEDTINAMFALWAKFKNQEPPSEMFKFNENFTRLDVAQFLVLYQTSGQLAAEIPELAKAMDKKLVDYLELTREESIEIQKAIDARAKAKTSISPATGQTEPKPARALNQDKFLSGLNGSEAQ